jgi:hypothetical protein
VFVENLGFQGEPGDQRGAVDESRMHVKDAGPFLKAARRLPSI